MTDLRILRTLPAAFLALALASTVALADDDSGRTFLERAVAHYAGLDAYAAEMEINLIMPDDFAAMGGGMPPSTYEVVAARDGRVAFRPQGGMISDPFVQDADRWYVEIGFLKAYVLKDAVPLARLLDGDGDDGVPIPGGIDFLRLGRRHDESGSLLVAETIIDAGVEEIGGVSCRRLELGGGSVGGEVWVVEGETPWIVRLRLDPPGPVPGEQDGMMMVSPGLDLVFSGWDDAPELDGAFAIEIDETFTRRDGMPGPEDFAGPGAGPGGEHESIGKPAPAVTLSTLDGGKLSMADLKGRVVVLDFWATWCKPCLMALPGVIEVTSDLADRGVAFWAVNQLENETAVRKLLDKNGWTLPVALDSDGAAGNAFGVRGIPHTVIIDKKGVVRHVHSGFMPGMESKLRTEIETLLTE